MNIDSIRTTVYARDVYGKSDLVIPEGYEYHSFSAVKRGDTYINGLSTDVEIATHEHSAQHPRIILKKKNPKLKLVLVFPAIRLQLFDGSYLRLVNNNYCEFDSVSAALNYCKVNSYEVE